MAWKRSSVRIRYSPQISSSKGRDFLLCFSYTSFTRKRLIATTSDQRITSKKGWSPTLPAFQDTPLLRMIGWSLTRNPLQQDKKRLGESSKSRRKKVESISNG